MTDRPDGGHVLTDVCLQRALDSLHTTTSGFTPESWQQAPPGRWNNAQIVEHLGKAYGSTAYILEKCVSDGTPRGRSPSWRQRLFTTLIVEVGYFPGGRQAPDVTVPEGMAGPEALAFACETLRTLDGAAARCEEHFGLRVRVANHPILGGFTVRQWRWFHWRHTDHHMRLVARRRA